MKSALIICVVLLAAHTAVVVAQNTTTTAATTTTTMLPPSTTTSTATSGAVPTTTTASSPPATTTTAAPPLPTPPPAPRETFFMQLVDSHPPLLQVRPTSAPSSAPFGYVCSRDLGQLHGPQTTSRTLCRLLGKNWTGASWQTAAAPPSSSGSVFFFLQALSCPPTATSVDDCSYTDNGNDCTNNDALSLSCVNAPAFDFALGAGNVILARAGNWSNAASSTSSLDGYGIVCYTGYSTTTLRAIARSIGAPSQYVSGGSAYIGTAEDASSIGLEQRFLIPVVSSVWCSSSLAMTLESPSCTIQPYQSSSSSSSCNYALQGYFQGSAGTESAFRLIDVSVSSLPSVLHHRILTAGERLSRWRPLCSDAVSASDRDTAALICSNMTGTKLDSSDPSAFLLFSLAYGGNVSVVGNELADDISPISQILCDSSSSSSSTTTSLEQCYLTANQAIDKCSSGLLSLACKPQMEYRLASGGGGKIEMRPGTTFPFGNVGLGPGTTRNSARALCRSFGLPHTGAQFFVRGQPATAPPVLGGPPPVYASAIRCNSDLSSVTSLVECPVTAPATAFHDHQLDAGLICANTADLVYTLHRDNTTGLLTMSIPLASVASNTNAVTTGLVCANGFGGRDTAAAICKMHGLPYSGASFSTSGSGVPIPPGASAVFAAKLNCPAGATSFASDCTFSTDPMDLAGCKASTHAVAVTCKNEQQYEFRVSSSLKILQARPVTPSSSPSTMPPTPSGPWGTISAKPSFSLATARWFCFESGLPHSGATWSTRREVTPSSTTTLDPSVEAEPIYLQAVDCASNATTSLNSNKNFSQACTFQESSVGVTHWDDVSLNCVERQPINWALSCSLISYSETGFYCTVLANTPSSSSSSSSSTYLCSNGFGGDDTAAKLCKAFGRPYTAASWVRLSSSSTAPYTYSVTDMTCDGPTETFVGTSDIADKCNWIPYTGGPPTCSYAVRLMCQDKGRYEISVRDRRDLLSSEGTYILVRKLLDTDTSYSSSAVSATGMTIKSAHSLCRLLGAPTGRVEFRARGSNPTYSYYLALKNLNVPFGATSLDQSDFDTITSSSEEREYSNALILSCRASPVYEFRIAAPSSTPTTTTAANSSSSSPSPPTEGMLQVRRSDITSASSSSSSSSSAWAATCSVSTDSYSLAESAASLCALMGYQPPASSTATASPIYTVKDVSGTQPGWKLQSVECPRFASATDCTSSITFAPCSGSGTGGQVVAIRCGAYTGQTPAPPPPWAPSGSLPFNGSQFNFGLSDVGIALVSKSLLVPQPTGSSLTLAGAKFLQSDWYLGNEYVCPTWTTTSASTFASDFCRIIGFQDTSAAESYVQSWPASSTYFSSFAFAGLSCPPPTSSSSNGNNNNSFITPGDCTFTRDVTKVVPPNGATLSPSASSSTLCIGYSSGVTAVACHSPDEYFRNGYFFRYHEETGEMWARAQKTGTYYLIDATTWGENERRTLCGIVGRGNAAGGGKITKKEKRSDIKTTILSNLRCPVGDQVFQRCFYNDNLTHWGGGDQPTIATITCPLLTALDYQWKLAGDGTVLMRSATKSNSNSPNDDTADNLKGGWGVLCGYSMTSYATRGICAAMGFGYNALNPPALRNRRHSFYKPLAFRMTCGYLKDLYSSGGCSVQTPSTSSSTKGSYCFGATNIYDAAVECSGVWPMPGWGVNTTHGRGVDGNGAAGYYDYNYPDLPFDYVGWFVPLGIIFGGSCLYALYRWNLRMRRRRRNMSAGGGGVTTSQTFQMDAGAVAEMQSISDGSNNNNQDEYSPNRLQSQMSL